MEQPYGLHLIETKCEITQTLHFSIPSPFQNRRIITVCVDLFPQGPTIKAEIWGTNPSLPFIEEESRIKLRSCTIPRPNVDPVSPQFIRALTETIIRNKSFTDAVAELLQVHAAAATMEGKYEAD